MGGGVMLLASAVALGASVLSAMGSPILDSLISRAAEISLALPSVVALVVLGALGVHDTLALGATVAAIRGLSAAKGTRAELHALLADDFVLGARGLGASRLDVIRRHLLPHVLEGVLAQSALAAASVVALEAALAFMGLGVASSGWGTLLADAARLGSPDLALCPALGVAATSGALLLVAAHYGARHRMGRSLV
jgi:ABC-type dipeptide/oligopeptide/nickel transport system permease subunit